MHKISDIKYYRAAIFLFFSFIILFVPGAINLKATHQSPEATEAILKGSAPFFPFYINDFIFPQRVRLHSTPLMIPNFSYRSLFFPTHIRVASATSQDVYGSDTVTIEYNGNPTYTVFTCNGTPLGPNQSMKSIYFIDAEGNLACSDVTANTPLLSNAQVIIENVDAMRILYGLGDDPAKGATQYVAANNPAFSSTHVLFLKINLLLRTFETDEDSQVSEFYHLGNNTLGPYKDHYPRRTLVFTLPTQKESL
jgi:hypothetical protein